MDCAQKIYPSAEILKTVNTTVHCTEKGCSSVFNSESNLSLHVHKVHKKQQLPRVDRVDKEYYCPEPDCVYKDSKFFKTLKLLKQHYLKSHSERKFICETCTKGFPTLSGKTSHSEYCGVEFKCLDCNAVYAQYESLVTHTRRKKHFLLEKNYFKMQNLEKSSSEPLMVIPKIQTGNCTSLQFFHVMPLLQLSKQEMCDKSSQTEIDESKLHTQCTQTCFHKLPRTCVETQTIGDYITFIVSDVSPDENLLRKDIETQTRRISSKTKSCNTTFNLSDFEFDSVKVEQNTSSTQTITTIPSELTRNSLDGPDLNFEFAQSNYKEEIDVFDSSSFLNCNIETQTDFLLDDELLNCSDYYSNMYTQTCDDVLFNELGLNNIQTQTVFDDMLRSVESQTTMSHNSMKNFMTCRDMAHMETQTDIEFKQILEEINA